MYPHAVIGPRQRLVVVAESSDQVAPVGHLDLIGGNETSRGVGATFICEDQLACGQGDSGGSDSEFPRTGDIGREAGPFRAIGPVDLGIVMGESGSHVAPICRDDRIGSRKGCKSARRRPRVLVGKRQAGPGLHDRYRLAIEVPGPGNVGHDVQRECLRVVGGHSVGGREVQGISSGCACRRRSRELARETVKRHALRENVGIVFGKRRGGRTAGSQSIEQVRRAFWAKRSVHLRGAWCAAQCRLRYGFLTVTVIPAGSGPDHGRRQVTIRAATAQISSGADLGVLPGPLSRPNHEWTHTELLDHVIV